MGWVILIFVVLFLIALFIFSMRMKQEDSDEFTVVPPLVGMPLDPDVSGLNNIVLNNMKDPEREKEEKDSDEKRKDIKSGLDYYINGGGSQDD